ncbi:hypothetical protein O3P69_001883 [Scylla paramamosain]|uniref:G-protein coupled receptors family 1 profile domain-containing protein n=1 Tax=Scylla paramamosain TaxID=85552 RepID=A0AAW0V145_SCYPA
MNNSFRKVLVFHVVRGPFIEDFYQCVTYGLYSPAWLEKLYAVFSLVSESEKVFRSERTTLGNTCPEFNRRRLLRKAKMRALRISVVIVLAFVICWTPYYMMMIIFLFTTVEDNEWEENEEEKEEKEEDNNEEEAEEKGMQRKAGKERAKLQVEEKRSIISGRS